MISKSNPNAPTENTKKAEMGTLIATTLSFAAIAAYEYSINGNIIVEVSSATGSILSLFGALRTSSHLESLKRKADLWEDKD